MADIPVIYILSRNNYNNFGDENYGNNIFFVRENSENLNDMISLYVGKAKQSDVVIVNGQSVWNNVTNTVNIGTGGVPEDYKVEGKLILAQRTINDQTFYNALTYNTSSGTFIDCGIPNNVVLVDEDWSTSDVSSGVRDFFYIQPSTHSIYVFNGSAYDPVITSTMFITREEAETRFVTNDKMPTADGVTIEATPVTEQGVTHSVFGVKTSGIVDDSTIESSGSTNKIGVKPSGIVDGFTIEVNGSTNKIGVKTSGIVDGSTIVVDSTTSKLTGSIVKSSGQIVTGTGNVVSGTDVPLATVVTPNSAASGTVTYNQLPRNGGEIRITNAIGTNQNGAISIADVSNMDKSDGTVIPRSLDYLSVIIFKKSSNLDDVTKVMPNFDATGTNKVYLMNPDIDISSYTVIHLMLYYDGFHMCAIVTGYQET